MTEFFGVIGFAVIVAAAVYFYKRPSKPVAKSTQGVDLANQGQNRNPGDGPKGQRS